MQYKNCIKLLLGIQEVEGKNIHDYGDILNFEIETKKRIHTWPCYKAKTNKIHDYRYQKIKHSVAYDNSSIYIILRMRRYVCKVCGKRFFKIISF